MTGLEFEGADDLTEVQLNLLTKVLKDNGYINNKVVIKIFGQPGDNFAGNVRRVIVKKENGEEFNMIMKTAPNVPFMRLGGRVESLFKNEDMVYNKLFPIFKEYQENAGIPEEEKLQHAKCYGAALDQFHEIILFEDLKEQGYGMLDKLTPLSDAQVKSILTNLAKLHALGFVLKNRDPNLFIEFEDTLTDVWGTMTDETKVYNDRFLEQIESNVLMVLKNEDHKKMVKKTISEAYDIMRMSLEEQKTSKHYVLQQGDAWINNVMFKPNSGNIPESIMIDYQQARSANPVCDLLYMIFNCTDYPTRKDYYLNWIDHYHNVLKDFLAKFKLDVNSIYPRDQLDSDLKRYGNAGLFYAMLAACLTIMNGEDAAKMKEAMENEAMDMDELSKNMDMGGMAKETFVKFKIRIQGAVKSLFEFGLISV